MWWLVGDQRIEGSKMTGLDARRFWGLARVSKPVTVFIMGGRYGNQ